MLPGEQRAGEELTLFICVCWSALHRGPRQRLARERSPSRSCANLPEDHVRVCVRASTFQAPVQNLIVLSRRPHEELSTRSGSVAG